jgi:magnesium-transporting ATPase (P-type)
VLDKTGTVTTGRMKLVDVIPAAGTLDSELLRLAGALEDASEHPVAGGRRRSGGDAEVADLHEQPMQLSLVGDEPVRLSRPFSRSRRTAARRLVTSSLVKMLGVGAQRPRLAG